MAAQACVYLPEGFAAEEVDLAIGVKFTSCMLS
jgi:hypothetical protein